MASNEKSSPIGDAGRTAVLAGGRPRHHPRARHGAVPRHRAADHARPAALGRRGAGGDAPQAAGRAGAAARSARSTTPARSICTGRHRRRRAALRHGARRQAPRDLPGRAPLPHHRVPRRLSVPRRPGRADRRDRGAHARDRGARCCNLRNQALEVLQLLPQTPAELANAVQGVDAGGRLADLIASFMDIKPGREAGDPGDVRLRARLERVSELLAYRHRSAAPVAPDQRADQGNDRRPPARIPAARAAEDDPEGARRRRRREEPGNRRAAKKIAEAKMPPEVEEQRRRELARLERMPEAPASIRWRAPISNG